MNQARLAVRLVERHGLSSKQALKYVLEDDSDGAAKAMAKNATDDPKEQKKLEAKFKEAMAKAMDTEDDMHPSEDEPSDKKPDEADDKDDKDEGDDCDDVPSKHESRRNRRR